jgi:hypothetical protein
MSISQDSLGLWSFTFGTETFDCIACKERAQELLYDLQRGALTVEQARVEWMDDLEEDIIASLEAPAAKPDLTRAVLEYIAGDEQPDLVDAVLEYVSLPADIPMDDDERQILDAVLAAAGPDDDDLAIATELDTIFQPLAIERGTVSLDIGPKSGAVGLLGMLLTFEQADVGALLDLRDILNQPEVVAKLQALYDPWDQILKA